MDSNNVFQSCGTMGIWYDSSTTMKVIFGVICIKGGWGRIRSTIWGTPRQYTTSLAGRIEHTEVLGHHMPKLAFVNAVYTYQDMSMFRVIKFLQIYELSTN